MMMTETLIDKRRAIRPRAFFGDVNLHPSPVRIQDAAEIVASIVQHLKMLLA